MTAKHTYPDSTTAKSSPETSQLLQDFGFNVERRSRLDPPLTSSVPFDELHQFNTPFPSTVCVDRDLGAEITTDYTNRHRSPFHAYLSPEYSSAHSPSMASDGMHDHSHEPNKIWMMTPTRDAEGNTPNRTSTPVSLGGTVNNNQAFVSNYDPAPSESTSTNWPSHRSGIQPSGQIDFCLSANQATNAMATIPPQQHQPVPSQYFNFSALTEDPSPNYPYDSARSLTDCSTSVGVLPYEREPLFEDSIQLSPEPHTGAVAGPSGTREPSMTNVEDPALARLSYHSERKPLTCKSCRKTITDPIEEAAHDRECDGLPCLFRFAGCKSRFKGKNEWKRHIKTQHLLSKAYVCPDCDMKEFNRKDLFKQHHIRMHSTKEELEAFKRKKPSEAFEKKLQEKLQQASCGSQTPSPTACTCFMLGCQTKFAEADSWERCLEHVAKHHEAVMKGKEAAREYNFTPEQLRYFQRIGALVHRNGEWFLGAQSSGERARKNKKKIARRAADGGPVTSAAKPKRYRGS
ncbi:hypothetical protein J3458_005462 [Metarhizium acridum]|uniref:uncharacterized protein n=1 Tax=Metarhizium acridum TaxID=92637 RepID=UPI001C6AC601|nr:hypothetical protein J3458_005462 [Metarhizium acridum]